MASYRRFVAYVYRYQNGRKGDNCGFVKVEARNGLCTFYLRMQGIRAPGTAQVFVFVRNADGEDFIPVGPVEVKDGLLHQRLDTDRLHMGGSGYTLEQCNGLLCVGENMEYYGTVWDDSNVVPKWEAALVQNNRAKERNPEEIAEPIAEAEEVRMTEPVAEVEPEGELESVLEPGAEVESERISELMVGMEPEGVLEPMADAESERVPEPIAGVKAEEVLEPIADAEPERVLEPMADAEPERALEPIVGMELERAPESIPIVKLESASEPMVRVETDSVPELMAEMEADSVSESITEMESDDKQELIAEIKADSTSESIAKMESDSTLESIAEMKMVQESDKSVQEQRPQDKNMEAAEMTAREQQEMNSGRRPLKTFEEMWAYMQQEYPRLEPFEDGGIVEGIKIAPSDIPYLQERNWSLGNNRFLLHGYKSYHHLLLGRVEGQRCYVLGVPGVFDQQEQFMAKMFGFPQFKPIRQCRNRIGQFGYWFRCIG